MRGMMKTYCPQGKIQPWPTIWGEVNGRLRLNFTQGTIFSTIPYMKELSSSTLVLYTPFVYLFSQYKTVKFRK